MNSNDVPHALSHDHDPRSIPIWGMFVLALAVVAAVVLGVPAHAFAATTTTSSGSNGGINVSGAANWVTSNVKTLFVAAIVVMAAWEFFKRNWPGLLAVVLGGGLASWIMNDPSGITSIGSWIGSFL